MARTTTDLLVSYPWRRFRPARREILRILKHLGDGSARAERTDVDGVALVHTVLDSREVIRRCSELFHAAPVPEFAIKWVPVDYWCDTDLAAMKRLITESILVEIEPHETWGMKVEKRRWQNCHTADIVAQLAPLIDRRVDLGHPDKLVRVDLVGRRTAISVLRPGDIFSVAARV
ncbi:MAG: THUMP domain-containing protein [Gammaproteobacteria bacterium]|nr:THUMP domain-containing protein [Gammaproteobacteria bacterium]